MSDEGGVTPSEVMLDITHERGNAELVAKGLWALWQSDPLAGYDRPVKVERTRSRMNYTG